MKKTYIITTVLVLLIGVVLSFVLYSNSPFSREKNSNVYDEDENISPAVEANDNIDGVPSRKEVSEDTVQPENDILRNSGEDDDSVSEGNVTDDNKNYETEDNENDEDHELESNIELEADTKSIRVSSGTETVYFYAETFIETEEILLIDSSTGSTVAVMVDDGRYSISGDDLMNDNVFSCKVEIDISQANRYEYYAVIGNDTIESNTVKIKVYADFTEKELFDRNEVFTAIGNWQTSDEFNSMDLDGKAEATYRLLIELSENGTADAPYSLIVKDSIHFDKDNYTYFFMFHSGDIGGTRLLDFD